MPASTSTPMAMAMPLSDMMFEVMPNCLIRMNEIRIEAGSGMVTIRMLRKCQRKTMWARATRRISSTSAVFSVAMVRSIRVLRS